MEPEREKILLDCGTSYAKIMRLSDGSREILPSKKLLSSLDRYEVAAATGHNTAMFNAAQTINELVALARGGLANLHLVPAQGLRASGLVNADGMDHDGAPLLTSDRAGGAAW